MVTWLDRAAGETRMRLLTLLRRSRQTIGSLSQALRLTDNAVRTHVSALERDGFARDAGSLRAERGKPARLYELTPRGEELFPKAYAPVLGSLVEEIARTRGPDELEKLLRAIGRRVGAGVVRSGGDEKARVNAAADALRSLGGDVEVEKTATGWRIQGHGCPLSLVTASHAEVCTLAKAVVEEASGQPVTECCERGERPRCAFQLTSSARR